MTVGQYLRPSARHLPVARWWTPEEFESIRLAAMAMGFAHVQSSPLTRSSYHARQAVEASAGPPAFQGDDSGGGPVPAEGRARCRAADRTGDPGGQIVTSR